jgi:hypothetical protein
MRRAVAAFVGRLRCGSVPALSAAVNALIRSLGTIGSSGSSSSGDFRAVGEALAALGQRHAALMECLVGDMFEGQVTLPHCTRVQN